MLHPTGNDTLTMKNFFLQVCCLVVVVNSCIEALDIVTTEEKEILIVEGFISTKPGPHLLKLSKSAQYGSFLLAISEPEEDAGVFIKDDTGYQTFLQELSPGMYYTPEGYQAEVGRSYTLIINSKGGQYISTAEKVEPVPKINNIEARWKKFPSIIPEDFRSGIELYATFEDPAETQNFLFWNTTGTFIMFTYPELYVDRDINLPMPIWSPKDCCERCFFEEKKAEKQFRIYSDNNMNGNEITTLAAYLPDNGGRFDEKYLVRLEQYSLTREAFQFYKLLNDQLQIDGDIFDPPPALISSNIISISNPGTSVIGYFHASDVHRDSIYIEATKILEPNRDLQINDDCREVGGFLDPPPYWQ